MKRKSGFTLIEILIVMAIITFIATLAFLANMDFYQSYAFSSNRDVLVALIQKARSRSLNNIDQMSHGVFVDVATKKYRLYDGVGCTKNYSSEAEIHPGITTTGVMDICFEQLSGDLLTPAGDLDLTDGKRSAKITLDQKGRIDW